MRNGPRGNQEWSSYSAYYSSLEVEIGGFEFRFTGQVPSKARPVCP